MSPWACTCLFTSMIAASSSLPLDAMSSFRLYQLGIRKGWARNQNDFLFPKAPCVRGGLQGKQSHEDEPRISIFYPIMIAWMYTMSVSLAIPSLPGLVNTVMNGIQVVTPRSQMAYSALIALDNSFTLVTNNIWCTLSDRYGRKPFMIMASIGIGIGASILATTNSLWIFCIGATIDGLTSCMHGLGQACLCDITPTQEIPKRFAAFMGLAIGVAFIFGIPISVILLSKVGPRAPFALSAVMAFINVFVILASPESLSPTKRRDAVSLRQANPLGVLHTLSADGLVAWIGLAYLFLQLAHMGLQVTFMNYVQRVLNWPVSKAGAVLSMSGLGMAVFPPLLLRFLRPRVAVEACLIIYIAGLLALSAARTDAAALAALATVSLGSSCLPCMLGYLANLARPGEAGAMQGAGETIRTACAALGGPALSAVFAVCLSSPRLAGGLMLWPGAVYVVSAGLLALSWACFCHGTRRFPQVDCNADIVPDGLRGSRAAAPRAVAPRL